MEVRSFCKQAEVFSALNEPSLFDAVKANIDATNMKFIIINMNSTINASDPNQFVILKKITGTGSNRQHWYTYQNGGNNAESILNSLYFDGNTRKSKALRCLSQKSFSF